MPETEDPFEEREIEIGWAGPVAGAIADAVESIVDEQPDDYHVQSVRMGPDGVATVETHVTPHLDVRTAALDALVEHHPDEIDDTAETAVAEIDVTAEEPSTITIREWPGGEA